MHLVAGSVSEDLFVLLLHSFYQTITLLDCVAAAHHRYTIGSAIGFA